MKMILKVLTSHDQELTEEELMQFQRERIWIEMEHNSEHPKIKLSRNWMWSTCTEILAAIDNAAMTAEKGGFYYERAHRFRADLQDILSA